MGALPLPALFTRNRPEDVGLRPYGDRGSSTPAAPPEGNPVALAFRALAIGARSRDFWLIAGGYFVCGATTNGLIGTHLIPACVDHGLSAVAGADLLASTGVFALLGGMLSGWLSDRWDNRLLLCGYYGLRGLSLLYLPFAFDMSVYGLPLFSIVYGLDWLASAAPTVCACLPPLSVPSESGSWSLGLWSFTSSVAPPQHTRAACCGSRSAHISKPSSSRGSC